MAARRGENRKKGAGRRGVLSLLACVAVFPVLTGCTEKIMFRGAITTMTAAMEGVFMRTDVNLKEKNYAAADFLAQRLKPAAGFGRLIAVRALSEVDNPGITSPLGTKIPEEIGLRLMDLGYKVDIRDVATGPNDGLYNGVPASAGLPAFVLTGSYLRNRDDMDVHLRVVDAGSGQVVAAFDYKLLLSVEVRKLSETPVRIYRVDGK